jgi:hypothetical protein
LVDRLWASNAAGWTMQAIFFPGVLDRGDWFRERDLQSKAPRVRPSFARSKSRCRPYGRVKPPGSERRAADLPAVRALMDSFCHDRGGEEYRDLARAMTAAICPKLAGESLTDVKEMENRKPWRHKKVPMDAIRSSRIWSRKVEEELCYGASQACFEGEASK